MEKNENKDKPASGDQKDRATEKDSASIKNANAAGDGAMERHDEDLGTDNDQSKRPLESNY